MNVLTVVKTVLTEAGIATPIKFNYMPDKPHSLIVVRDTGEVTPDPNMTATTIEDRTVQVLVRGSVYETVKADVDAIRAAMHGVVGRTEGDTRIMSMMIISGLQPITNEVGNYEFSGNFRLKVRPA